jgi:hypothetical protein
MVLLSDPAATTSVSPEEAERHILGYLRNYPGEILSMWPMLNKICPGWSPKVRSERAFYIRQLTRLIKEKKVKRYRTVRFRNQIRISEAYVKQPIDQ